MNVFGHYNVPTNIKPVPLSDPFERDFEEIACFRSSEQWFAIVTTERDEVQTSRFLKSFQSPRHAQTLGQHASNVCDE